MYIYAMQHSHLMYIHVWGFAYINQLILQQVNILLRKTAEYI